MKPGLANLALLAAFIVCAITSAAARAQSFAWADWERVRVCPAEPGAFAPPDFESPACSDAALYTVDPQDRFIWVRLIVPLGADLLDGPGPLGVYISGKAASRVYLNGEMIGTNGVPGANRGSEIPGRMDAVLFAPRAHLQAGENTLVLLMSGHHSLMQLGNPLHVAGVGRYGDPTALRLKQYWPALMTFGALIAGSLYFAVIALRGPARVGSAALSLAAASAAAQLLAEAWRGLSAYAYPMHDVRLLLIVVFAALSGSALALFAWSRAYARGRLSAFVLALVIAALAAVTSRGFDLKAVIALLAPVAFALGALAGPAWRGRGEARIVTALLAVFAIAVLLAPSTFLDRFFFQLMAVFLFGLFIQQAVHLSRETRLRREEEGRAQRLEAALARAREARAPSRLSVISAGRVDLVETERIVRCQGAGDYVELYLTGGACLLHAGTLGELEAALPPTFLRVHRSHIVNSSLIEALDRDASGVGMLTLSDGTSVPVSRRIMPRVRSALKRASPFASAE